METENSISDLRIASFAIYLNPGEDNFVKKLMEPGQLPASATLTPNEEPPVPIRTAKVVPKDGEIGVFGAEKYFNMNIDDDDDGGTSTTPRLVDDYARKLRFKKENHIDPPPPYCNNSKIRSGTPSISSESSWNSQSTFLRSFQRNLSQSRHKKVSDQRGFLAGLSCYRSCNDRKSIYVSKNIPNRANGASLLAGGPGKHPQPAFQAREDLLSPSIEKKPRVGSNRMDHFAFPVLNTARAPHNVVTGKQFEEKVRILPKEDVPRVSLEVFGSNPKTKADNIVAMNLERKLSMLTWDAIPKTKSVLSSAKSGGLDEDMASEASSDLFEIENISAAGSMPPMMYEPSEASIEWSVVTASAADFSILSDYDEKEISFDAKGTNYFPSKGNIAHDKLNSTRLPDMDASKGRQQSGLLGCKSQKAVQVAETVHRAGDRPKIARPQLRLETVV